VALAPGKYLSPNALLASCFIEIMLPTSSVLFSDVTLNPDGEVSFEMISVFFLRSLALKGVSSVVCYSVSEGRVYNFSV
jgi:hypothetical protein